MSVSDHATEDATTTNNMDHYVQEMKHEEPMLEFSEDEEDLVARMFRLVGKRWSLIAGRIPGRTTEEVERYWTSKYASPSERCSSSAKASENVISNTHDVDTHKSKL